MYCTLQTQGYDVTSALEQPEPHEPDSFCELLDFAMPWEDGLAAVLIAYFDAGTQKGTLSVAGFAYGADRAKKAIRDWVKLWGDTRCHMTDLHNLKGDFRDWDKYRSRARIEASIPIIKAYASYAVAVSCDVAEVERLCAPLSADPDSKHVMNGFASAYALCSHLAARKLATMVADGQKIAHFFEAGDEHQGASQTFMRWIVSANDVYPMYKCGSITVQRKTESRLFEHADILAWEWARHINLQAAEPGKEMRRSLTALLGPCAPRVDGQGFSSLTHQMMHVTGPKLQTYYQKAEAAGLFRD